MKLPLKTRKMLILYKLYGISTLNMYRVSALLALIRRYIIVRLYILIYHMDQRQTQIS